MEMVADETMPQCQSNPSDMSGPQKQEQTLPKLSPQEFKIYNRMAEHMNYFVRWLPPPLTDRCYLPGP